MGKRRSVVDNTKLFYLRSDIYEDTGSSLSPEVDIGQIEGAYIFGVGLWTSEVIKFHPETGKIITFDTWVSMQGENSVCIDIHKT